nr:DUF2325 domain-containing protein [Calditerricola satsumensis]
MTVLVVGADRLGNIEAFFRKQGYREILHVSGRKASDTAIHIPSHVHMVVVFTDFVNHNLARVIKPKPRSATFGSSFRSVRVRRWPKPSAWRDRMVLAIDRGRGPGVI